MNGNAPAAYSRLRIVLAERNLSVFQLHRRLGAAGWPVNIKSLYRLTSDTPLQKVDLRVAGAICQECGVGIGDLITFQRPVAQLQRLEPKKQARLDELMSKNNEGKLTTAEKRQFEALADEAHRVSIENARMLLGERRRRQAADQTKAPAPARRPSRTRLRQRQAAGR